MVTDSSHVRDWHKRANKVCPLSNGNRVLVLSVSGSVHPCMGEKHARSALESWMRALWCFSVKKLHYCLSLLLRELGQPSSRHGSGPTATEASREVMVELARESERGELDLILRWVKRMHCWVWTYWLVHPLIQQLVGFWPKAKNMGCGCLGQSYCWIFIACLQVSCLRLCPTPQTD